MVNCVKEARNKKGVKQKELAHKAGIGQSTLSEIERNVTIPGVDIALRIARELHCLVEDIFVLT